MAKDTKLCVKCGKEKPIRRAKFCPNDHMTCYDCSSSYKTTCAVCAKEAK